MAKAIKKYEETLDCISCFPLHFFRTLAVSCVLYNRTEHSQGFLTFFNWKLFSLTRFKSVFLVNTAYIMWYL